ncbi:hypothetical protein [Streptomyces sp. NPDC088925]|uniref:hypothetical protein n=1 Tax=Streptomyces sp. NPDC088925 TaxID=3365914 RepID=UPI00380E851A
MRVHPLAAIADTIDPDESYTYADLAELAGVSPATAGKWGLGGWLGEGGREEIPAGKGTVTRWRYSGRVLLDALAASRRPQIPHQPLAPTTSYGYGCRHEGEGTDCECLRVHNRLSRERRRRRAADRFPPERRERFLQAVRSGTPPPEAATLAGTTLRAAAGFAVLDENFRAQYVRARESLCLKRAPGGEPFTSPCGGAGAYRLGCWGRACYERHQRGYREPAGPARGLVRAAERAAEAGFPDVTSYLAAHADLSGAVLAARLGVSKQSVYRWRADLEASGPGSSPGGRDEGTS